MSCRSSKKSSCESNDECIWLSGKGCKARENVPIANLAKMRKSTPIACTKEKKATCESKKDCIWIPSKGCRDEDTVPLAILAKLAAKQEVRKMTPKKPVEKKEKKVATGCSKMKKQQCDTAKDCLWAEGRCRVEDNIPLAVLAKIIAKAEVKKAAAKKRGGCGGNKYHDND